MNKTAPSQKQLHNNFFGDGGNELAAV